MHVLVFASRKGGAGKSTLAANFAAFLAESERRTLLVDTDRQGSLELWHRVRGQDEPRLKAGMRDLDVALRRARQEGTEWVIVDTPPNVLVGVSEAIKFASLVIIPTRPSLFDIAAVQDTVRIAEGLRKPYAVVINAAPARRGNDDHAIVKDARGALKALNVPVWHGQITHNPDISLSTAYGQGVAEYGTKSAATEEMAQLYKSLTRTMEAIGEASRKRST